ncbi:oxaloacetate decarboxylase [Amycolatopsis sp. GM8]|uniref:isocitrate lyase/PEP mutase family protein n=1 Tax=Amycolatopsis sp. GM8 TaxID=2896530 RepID=UPI001F22CD65|nr:isocitrate lyase/PEP mutase family protein [Amycolatopsis sp. GM8]
MTAIREKFRARIGEPGLIIAPGAADVLTAKLVEQLGFEAVYVGGYGIASVAYGLPDTGLVAIPELVAHAGTIADAVALPVIADLDDGGGIPLRIRRNVRLLEKAGVAAFHLEDLDLGGGKHLGTSERLRPIEAAVANIEAAVEARSDDDLLVIGRTDALSAGGSLDEAIDRLGAYADAGADLVFAATLHPSDVARVRAAIDRPLLNTFIPDRAAPDQLDTSERDGVKIVVHSSSAFRVAYEAVRGMLVELKTDRTDRSLAHWDEVRAQIDETIDARAWRRYLP